MGSGDVKQPSKPAGPAAEYLYTVSGDIWNGVSVVRARILKRTPNGMKVERGRAVGINAVISYEDARRRGIVGSAYVAVIEWRAKLKKTRDEMIDELAQIEKMLKGPDPKENF